MTAIREELRRRPTPYGRTVKRSRITGPVTDERH